jgi:type II secretion system protein I
MRHLRTHRYMFGFTLVEVFVAISILSLAILATFTAVQGSIRSAGFAEDQIVAYYLAQEGLEFIRNARDENGIKNTQFISSGSSTSQPWLTGIANSSSDPCYPGKKCSIDSPLKLMSACPLNVCPPLRFDTVSGFYGYTSTWTVTPFTRSVSIISISPNEAKVTVDVSWVTSGIPKTFSVSEILRDWQ